MPFFRLPRPDLLTRIRQDFNTALPGTDAMLRRSVVGVLSFAHGMAMDAAYAMLAWIARQIIPTTADEEMLLRWARLFLPVPRLDATFAAGEAAATGTMGAVIPAGTVMRRSDGVLFQTDAEVTIAGGVTTVSLSAQVAGSAGNCAPSTILTLLSPVSGVNNRLTVSSFGVTGGAEVETLEAVLARLQRRVQTPPRAGSGDDYINWTFDALPTVTRAWAFPRENGAGSVTVRFACDSTYSGGIPLAGDVSAVESYINSQRPVTGELIIAAPVAAPVDFTITGLTPNTTALKEAIAASLADLIQKEGTPGGNYWTGYTTTAGGTILRSHFEEVIASVPGVNDFTLANPSTNVTVAVGHLHTMGTISWT